MLGVMDQTTIATQTRDREAARVEDAAPGWRCVWLPRHSQFLAFRDTQTAASGVSGPAVAEPDADAVLEAIAAWGNLRDVVRDWITRQQGAG